MGVSPSLVRTHRIIGGLAVVHAVIVAGIVIGMGLYGWFPGGRLWVAFVTLWLFDDFHIQPAAAHALVSDG